jgi:DUF1680 family protein
MRLNRRSFVGLGVGAAFASRLPAQSSSNSADLVPAPLRSPQYAQVAITAGPALALQSNALAVLASLDDDALLKPIREMGTQPAPGRRLDGWYAWNPGYDFHHDDVGFAPAHCFGQWASAMARFAAAEDDPALAQRACTLTTKLGQALTPAFFEKTRFPAYTLDKFNCGLMDAHHLAQSPDAFAVAGHVLECAQPSLPGHAVARGVPWRPGHLDDPSYTWDESYTISENLYLLYTLGAGDQYRTLARAYLLDQPFFDPLARNQNVLGGLHAYSHMNAMGSAMQAWFVDSSRMHLDAARNGFQMVAAQSFATGGWGPDETFEHPGSGAVLASLNSTHNSFETPCGTYATLKLARYLLQATGDGQYGDAMEQVLWNAMFGALPLEPDGRTFYYADVNNAAKRVYSDNIWPCCAGTYPQVAADFGINAYQFGPEGQSLWVNLYLPSQMHWTANGAHLTLTQTEGYPETERVSLHLQTTQPTRYTLRFRIPAWCTSPSLLVNGQPVPLRIVTGFAVVDRTWRSGDRLELRLPASLRLWTFPGDGRPQSRSLAALGWGPWVLLPLHPSPEIREVDALKAQRVGPHEWHLPTPTGDLTLRPFFAVGDSPYSTYMRLT